ncbi:MAG: hypothetical protein A3F17_06710 [Gammaproteobacteria bacterium RIFCSPHIGHO2_12_FULL_41_15]|nr:MAG: hypothetical protein A3F17_06710 [Gammaproteobacteria bacterium RIFCSPHIGHO2_12_FULL_41_15]
MKKTTIFSGLSALALVGFAVSASAAILTVSVTNVTGGGNPVSGCIQSGKGMYCIKEPFNGQNQTASYTKTENKQKKIEFKFSLIPNVNGNTRFIFSSRCAGLGVTAKSEANGYFATYKVDISQLATAQMNFFYNSADQSAQGGKLDCSYSAQP